MAPSRAISCDLGSQGTCSRTDAPTTTQRARAATPRVYHDRVGDAVLHARLGKGGYVVVYYRGSNDAWDGYGGAVIYTRAKPKPRREDAPDVSAEMSRAALSVVGASRSCGRSTCRRSARRSTRCVLVAGRLTYHTSRVPNPVWGSWAVWYSLGQSRVISGHLGCNRTRQVAGSAHAHQRLACARVDRDRV